MISGEASEFTQHRVPLPSDTAVRYRYPFVSDFRPRLAFATITSDLRGGPSDRDALCVAVLRRARWLESCPAPGCRLSFVTNLATPIGAIADWNVPDLALTCGCPPRSTVFTRRTWSSLPTPLAIWDCGRKR